MRKSIYGLSVLVAMELDRDPADRALYVFTNKGRDKIKLLIWHINGYWCLYKKLDYLLDGYNLNGMRPHRKLVYARHL